MPSSGEVCLDSFWGNENTILSFSWFYTNENIIMNVIISSEPKSSKPLNNWEHRRYSGSTSNPTLTRCHIFFSRHGEGESWIVNEHEKLLIQSERRNLFDIKPLNSDIRKVWNPLQPLLLWQHSVFYTLQVKSGLLLHIKTGLTFLFYACKILKQYLH